MIFLKLAGIFFTGKLFSSARVSSLFRSGRGRVLPLRGHFALPEIPIPLQCDHEGDDYWSWRASGEDTTTYCVFFFFLKATPAWVTCDVILWYPVRHWRERELREKTEEKRNAWTKGELIFVGVSVSGGGNSVSVFPGICGLIIRFWGGCVCECRVFCTRWSYVIVAFIHAVCRFQGNGHEHDFLGDARVYILDIYNASIYPHDERAKRTSSNQRYVTPCIYVTIILWMETINTHQSIDWPQWLDWLIAFSMGWLIDRLIDWLDPVCVSVIDLLYCWLRSALNGNTSVLFWSFWLTVLTGSERINFADDAGYWSTAPNGYLFFWMIFRSDKEESGDTFVHGRSGVPGKGSNVSRLMFMCQQTRQNESKHGFIVRGRSSDLPRERSQWFRLCGCTYVNAWALSYFRSSRRISCHEFLLLLLWRSLGALLSGFVPSWAVLLILGIMVEILMAFLCCL